MRAHPSLQIISLGLICSLSSAAGCDGCAATPEGSMLTGRQFLLDSAEGFTPVDGTRVSVRFTENGFPEGPGFGFSAGCNSHFGSYTLRDGALVIDGLGATEIGCDEALSSQDAWLAAFFTASPTMALDGDQLDFRSEQATLSLLDREVADPDRPLTGRVWTVDSFIDATAVHNFGGDVDPTFTLDEDGSLRFFTGCNNGNGRYTAGDDSLTLSELSRDDALCDGVPGEKEARFEGVFTEGQLHFEIDAARLTLMRGDTGLGAVTP